MLIKRMKCQDMDGTWLYYDKGTFEWYFETRVFIMDITKGEPMVMKVIHVDRVTRKAYGKFYHREYKKWGNLDDAFVQVLLEKARRQHTTIHSLTPEMEFSMTV